MHTLKPMASTYGGKGLKLVLLHMVKFDCLSSVNSAELPCCLQVSQLANGSCLVLPGFVMWNVCCSPAIAEPRCVAILFNAAAAHMQLTCSLSARLSCGRLPLVLPVMHSTCRGKLHFAIDFAMVCMHVVVATAGGRM